MTTKAQKLEKLLAETAAQFAVISKEYPARLARAMVRFANLDGFELQLRTELPEMSFTFKADGDYRSYEFVEHLPLEIKTWEDYYVLESVEEAIVKYYDHLAENLRRNEVLHQARIKLNATFNAEERELLGL